MNRIRSLLLGCSAGLLLAASSFTAHASGLVVNPSASGSPLVMHQLAPNYDDIGIFDITKLDVNKMTLTASIGTPAAIDSGTVDKMAASLDDSNALGDKHTLDDVKMAAVLDGNVLDKQQLSTGHYILAVNYDELRQWPDGNGTKQNLGVGQDLFTANHSLDVRWNDVGKLQHASATGLDTETGGTIYNIAATDDGTVQVDLTALGEGTGGSPAHLLG